MHTRILSLLLAMAMAMAIALPAAAAQIRIPALDGARASVQLVTAADRRPVLGFEGPEWATAYQALDLSTAQTLTLTQQADIAAAGAAETCYLMTITAAGERLAAWCVVATDGPVQELRDLVGAEVPAP